MSRFLASSANLTAPALDRPSGTWAKTQKLGPVSFSPLSIEQLERLVCDWLAHANSNTFTVGYVNPHVFNLACRESSVRAFFDICDIAAIDGLGIAVPVSLLTGRIQTRTVMTPLFDRVLANPRVPQRKAILIGGSAEVLAKGAAAINRTAGGIQVKVTADGYRPMETYLRILEANADHSVVLVAMGSPRSEEIIVSAARRFPGRLFWNIGGGTLHYYAGTLARPPRAVSAAGLQWLWRIVHEPSIAPRYLIGIPLFLFRLLKLSLSKRPITRE